jgi:hypothetical protein
MTNSYTSIFGGSPVRPTNPSYLALALTANMTLVWPLETMETTPYVAAQIDVTPAAGGLSLAMPPANTGSTGPQTLIENVGANAFTLTDNAGNQIAVIQPGVAWFISLTSNTTVAGTWRATQLGATTSSATAGSLAGLGLQANGSLLQAQFPSFNLSGNTLLTAAYRAGFIVWTGAAGGLQLDTVANNTTGWFCIVANYGTDTCTLTCPGGDTINNQASFPITVGNSALIQCHPGGYFTAGNVAIPLPISEGGTDADNAPQALTNLGGTSIGTSIFTAPSASAVLALLGITGVTFTESSISSNQSITAGNSQTAYVATAALDLDLPLTTGGAGLTTSFIISVYAHGGAVTLKPQPADKINGGSAGANYVFPAQGGGMVVTDANGNWYIVCESLGNAFATAVNLNLGSAASANTGTSGHVVPFLDGNNTYSGSATFTGFMELSSAGAAEFIVSGANGNLRAISYSTTGSLRWNAGASADAEGGGNAGSNYVVDAYDNTGNILGRAINIARATQIVTLVQSPVMPTPAAGDSSTKGATTAFAQGVGFGQVLTNHDVSGSAALNVAQTNSTTQVKFVSVTVQATADGNLTLTVPKNGGGTIGSSVTVLNTKIATVCGYVPPGGQYTVVAGTGVQGTVIDWYETY